MRGSGRHQSSRLRAVAPFDRREIRTYPTAGRITREDTHGHCEDIGYARSRRPGRDTQDRRTAAALRLPERGCAGEVAALSNPCLPRLARSPPRRSGPEHEGPGLEAHRPRPGELMPRRRKGRLPRETTGLIVLDSGAITKIA